MKDEWFYVHDGQRIGPVALDHLQGLAKRQLLKPTDMVCCGASDQWRSACDVSELFEAGSENERHQNDGSTVRTEPAMGTAAVQSRPPVAQLVLDDVPAHTHGTAGRPQRSWLNAVMMLALLMTLPFWLLGSGRWVALTGFVWVIVGGRAAWTGVVPTGFGSEVFHPIRYRILGTLLVVMGVVLIVGAGALTPR